MPSELTNLRSSLVRRLGAPLGPADGDEAFDRHILLAVRIHRAACLNGRKGEGEGGVTWQRYFVEHFPERRNAPEDAIWLWNEWRTRLLKHESPRGITHGSPAAHWQPLPDGGFIVDLESMWSDFVNSVNGFVAALDADAKRWKVVRARWRERAWTVRSIPVVPSEQLYPSAALYAGAHSVSASYSTSTAMISGQEKLPITLPTPPTIASLENENPA